MDATLLDILNIISADSAKFADDWVDAHAPAILEQAKTIEPQIIERMAEALIADLPNTGIFKYTERGVIIAVIHNAVPQIIGAMGGMDVALIALVKRELAQVIKNGIDPAAAPPGWKF